MTAAPPPDIARRQRVATLVTGALETAGLGISPPDLDDALRAAELDGARIVEQELIAHEDAAAARTRTKACFAQRIAGPSLHRIAGLGAWQARALAGEAAMRAGAIFNLGIVLFDAALDSGGPEARAEALAFDLAALSYPAATPEFAFFQTVARRFFVLAGPAADHQALARLLAAERASVTMPGNARVLRAKSVGPFLVMASLGRGDAAVARAFGRAVWIVDDLWDWDEDGAAQTGRPWLRGGDEEDVLAAEARCLATALGSTRGWPQEACAALSATLAAWVRMPVPQPLFAALPMRD